MSQNEQCRTIRKSIEDLFVEHTSTAFEGLRLVNGQPVQGTANMQAFMAALVIEREGVGNIQH